MQKVSLLKDIEILAYDALHLNTLCTCFF